MSNLSGCSLIVGIDVGSASGCIAVLNVNDFSVQFHSLPTISRRTIRKSKEGKRKYIVSRRLDESALLQLLKNILCPIFPPFPALLVLEHQQPFPRQGSVTSGKLCYAYGFIKCALTMLHPEVMTVLPAKWKKAVGAVVGNDATRYRKKCKSWEVATTLHPELLETLSPKYKNFDRCDALLLCHFGLQRLRRKGRLKDDGDI